jgi:hypothetical protein
MIAVIARGAAAPRGLTVPEIDTHLSRAGFAGVQVATRPMWVYGWGRKPPG